MRWCLPFSLCFQPHKKHLPLEPLELRDQVMVQVPDKELPECVIPGVLSLLQVEDICRCACLARTWASWVHSSPIAERVLNEKPRGISHKIGDQRLVKLLCKGTTARCGDRRFDGFTPLHFAATQGHHQLVDALLACGVPVDIEDKCSQTALHLAAKLGYDSLVEELLDMGADVNAKTTTISTPLMMAAQYGHGKVVKVLLKRGAALDTTDMDDDTALNLAAKWGHNSVVRALIAAGANLNIRGLYGGTALGWSQVHKHSDTAELLIQAGATSQLPEETFEE